MGRELLACDGSGATGLLILPLKSVNEQIVLEPVVNFIRARFEIFFRGCFIVFTRKIAGYLTRENGKKDQKKTQK